MNNLPNPTGESSILDLIERRVSCRRYKPDPVQHELIDQILEAARLAPSACNSQPWRFAIVTDPHVRKRLASDGLLPGLGMSWVADAPVLLVLGLHKSFVTHRVAPKISGVDYAMIDLGIAGEHAILQATGLGLGTCWIGWINPKAVRRIVEWPRDITPQALITIGWPADAVVPTRNRLSATEIGKWI